MAPFAQAGGAGGTIPPGVDPMEFLLDMPALQNPPPGADLTMTTDGPDQVWYLVVAITCIAVPGLFLMIRMYTKLVIVRSLELADCKYYSCIPLMGNSDTRFRFPLCCISAHRRRSCNGVLHDQIRSWSTSVAGYVTAAFQPTLRKGTR